MELKKIQDVDVQGKKVLARIDFNVLTDDKGDVKSHYKLAAAKQTVDYLVQGGATHVALLTHFGRPEKDEDRAKYSLACLEDDVSEILGRAVTFVPDCVGDVVTEALDGSGEGGVFLLENVRFYAEEKENDATFAQKLAAPFDLYVGDAFGVSHRRHASLCAIAEHLPVYAGFWIQKELERLKKVKRDPDHPAVAIIGGAKIDTKIPMIEEFSPKYEKVLVGGRTAVEAQERGMVFDANVVLPSDYAQEKFDIGPETIASFVEEIAKAKTVVWNGPMGKIEDVEYKKGTHALLQAIADNEECFSLVGGGESTQLVEESGLAEKFSFISTGGGAMLAYLGGEEMPGVDVLVAND